MVSLSVQPKFEILVFFAIEPWWHGPAWSESWTWAMAQWTPDMPPPGQRITMAWNQKNMAYKPIKKHPK